MSRAPAGPLADRAVYLDGGQGYLSLPPCSRAEEGLNNLPMGTWDKTGQSEPRPLHWGLGLLLSSGAVWSLRDGVSPAGPWEAPFGYFMAEPSWDVRVPGTVQRACDSLTCYAPWPRATEGLQG